MSVTRYHAELTQVDKNKNEHIIYPKTTVSDVYTTSTSGVTITGKLSYYAECSTEMYINEKTVTIPGFVLVDGVHVSIRFTGKNSAFLTGTSWTLAINGGAAIQLNMTSATTSRNITMVNSGDIITFVYSASTNTFVRIASKPWMDVTMGSGTDTSRFYLTGISGVDYLTEGTYTSADALILRSKIYAEGNVLHADRFSGNGSSLTNLNASNIAAGTLSSGRLPDISGLIPASYGPSADMTLNASGSFNVPSISVDSKGRVTTVTNRTIKLPADNNDKVTINMNAPSQSTGKLYLALSDYDFTGSTASQLIGVSNIYYDTVTKDIYFPGGMHASNVYITNEINCKDSAGNSLWNINKQGIFSGKSSSVLSISEHISATEESTSKAYPSANGVALYNDVAGLKTSKQDEITGAATTITDANLTAGRVLVSDANGKVSVSTISSTKLGYLSNVSSDIQTQITTATNNISLIGTLYTASWQSDAIRIDKDGVWATKACVNLPKGTYIIRISVNGIWKGYRTHIGIGWSEDGLASYTYKAQGVFPDINKGMSHTMQFIDILTTTASVTNIFPYLFEDVDDDGAYGDSHLNSINFSVKAIRVK